LKLVDRSGSSSWRWLQNVQGSWDPRIQPLGLGLALTESFLGRKGACRVHGGGFGGTLQTWVPIDLFDSYRGYMEGLLGPGCVTRLRTRREGAGEIKAGNRRVAPGSGKR
ncbi:MAG TPA: hypothetical protein VLH39_00990, partial [Magnetospirillaceae bacterium]|nr:hypothetical protein [Magnetospirillaceae bacterium]